MAGVQKGAHTGAAGPSPGAHSAFRFPRTGLVGGGRRTPVGPLTSDMSEAAASPLRAAFIVLILPGVAGEPVGLRCDACRLAHHQASAQSHYLFLRGP